MQPPVAELVAHSTARAEAFVKLFYATLDQPVSSGSPTSRTAALVALYSPHARIAWNGNPIPVPDLAAFLDRLPRSDHRVQAYDCHPIAGALGSPPSLVLTVTGQVTHGGRPHPPPGTVPSKHFDHLPRVFSQSFILAAAATAAPPTAAHTPQGVGGYVIVADSYRFC